MVKKRSLAGILMPAALALAIPIAAQAQPGTPNPPGNDKKADVTPAEDDKGEVIVVTGSTIARRQTTTAAPVAIMDRAEIDASGMVSIGEILQNLPSQSNAINVQFNNGGTGATRISLRGLGSGRTLVLVNGRRYVPGGSGANGSVDLNSIPVAVIERVEVLKDGASAVYGSDAIGGVVNIIMRESFEGTEATVYTGSTSRGDGQQYDLNVTSGIKSKKGSIMFSAGFFDQRKIMAGERNFSKSDKFFDFATDELFTNGSSAPPNGLLIDRLGQTGNAAWQDVVNNGCTSGACYRDPTDGWRDANFNGNSDVGEGDLYNYQPENYLLTPQRRFNIWTHGNYKLRDNVKAYFEAGYTKRRSSQLLAPTPLFTISEGITVSGQNHYNPFGRDFIDIRRRMVEQGGRHFSQDIDTFRIVGGLKGRMPESTPLKNWRWDLHYNFGRTSGTDINEGRFVRSRVINAIGPSFVDGDGVATCGTPEAPIANCVPLNLFGGAGTITQEQLKYISYTGIANGFSQMHSIRGSMNGKLADTPWGGDVRIALGTEFRDSKGGFTPDPITASGNTTGNKQEPTGGGFNVIEGYTEISAVLATGKPWAKWLEVNAAARAFDYNTFGTDFTYKVGGLWKVPQGIAIRGTYSTAFRAPAISELFAGNADDFALTTDPCDTSLGAPSAQIASNCATDGIAPDFTDQRTQQRAIVGGNANLDPETAKIITAGIVIEPKQVKGLALTFDFFNVSIDNAIQAKGAALILSNCYAQAVRADCDKITRDPTTNLIKTINDTQSNIGGDDTAGIDFQVRYDWAHATFGRFRHNFEGTYLLNYDRTLPDDRVVEGKGVYDIGVFPDWRFNFSTMWGYKALGVGANVRYIGGFKECADDDCDTLFDETSDDYDAATATAMSRNVKANITADLFVSYDIKSPMGKSKVTLGVNNLLDQDPSVIYNGFLGTSDASTYDFMGRYFYARYSQKF